MNWLRKSISMMGLIALTLSSASFAQEVDKTKPYEMIEVVADNLFSRLKAEKVQIEDNPDQLKSRGCRRANALCQSPLCRIEIVRVTFKKQRY